MGLLGHCPSLAGFEARQAGHSLLGLDHAPIAPGGRGASGWWCPGSACWFCSVGRMVEQSEHPFPEGCGFHVPAWQHFLRTLQTNGQATEATLQEGILPWLLHSEAQKLVSCWQLWVVCLPTVRVALLVFALGPGLHLVLLLPLGSGANRGWGGAFPVSLRSHPGGQLEAGTCLLAHHSATV